MLVMILAPLLNFFVTAIESSWFATREIKAQGLVREGLEAVRSVRERNWEEMTVGDYYPESSSGIWQLVASETGETIGPFTRQVKIEPVYRDDEDNIVSSPGRLDPSTKSVTVTISWHSLRDRVLALKTYFTRYLDNLVWLQTLKAEFDQGEFELTKTLDPPNNDGEVYLEGGCVSGTPEALIYDDELQNGWRVNCDGLSFWQWLICRLTQLFSGNASIDEESSEQTYDSSAASMKMTLSGYGWSWIRIFNYEGVCTKGFQNLHFYAYNPSSEQVTVYLTAIYEQWETAEIVLPPQEWTEVSIDYDNLEDYGDDLVSLYFHQFVGWDDPEIVIYIDQVELTGGVGGYFTQGTFTSEVFDAGRETSFNRIAFDAEIPANTGMGFQVATSDQSIGPWLFYGPGGTSSDADLYTDENGEGIWLGNNQGQFCRYKAFLFSHDGESSPTLNEVTINYAP